MLVVVLVYQQVENNILTPKIQGKAVNLSAFFIILAVTLFGALLGVLGALTAVPLAAMIQIFVQELTKARRERVEAANAALEPAGQGLTLALVGLDSAFCLSVLNSASVIAPLSSRAFAFSISPAEPPLVATFCT